MVSRDARLPTGHFLRLYQGSSPVQKLIEPEPPENFLWAYSYGGREDSFIDVDRDRVADVFPDEEAITEAGWSSQEASDLLAVLGPRLVGVPANRIPQFLKRLSQWQAEIDAERHHKRSRHLPLVPRDRVADAATPEDLHPRTRSSGARPDRNPPSAFVLPRQEFRWSLLKRGGVGTTTTKKRPSM